MRVFIFLVWAAAVVFQLCVPPWIFESGPHMGFRTYSEVSRAFRVMDGADAPAQPSRGSRFIDDEAKLAQKSGSSWREDAWLCQSVVNVPLLGLDLAVTTAIAAGAWFIVPASRRRKRVGSEDHSATAGCEPDASRFRGGRE